MTVLCVVCHAPATFRAGRHPLCDQHIALPENRRRRRFDPDAPHQLVAVDPEVCPACGSPTVASEARVDALLRHGGHGATLRTVRRSCPVCPWAIVAETAEERPPR